MPGFGGGGCQIPNSSLPITPVEGGSSGGTESGNRHQLQDCFFSLGCQLQEDGQQLTSAAQVAKLLIRCMCVCQSGEGSGKEEREELCSICLVFEDFF